LLIFPDDSYFLSGSKDKSILCWDLKKQRRTSEKTLRIGGINSFILCPDSNSIISVGTDKQLTFWDIRCSESMKTIEYSNDKTYEPTTIALSNNGKYFAVGGTDDKFNLYLTQTADKIATTRDHSFNINKIVFSPDDKQIISVGDDGCVIVWDLLLK
jgi:WD40 repeat protein